MSSGGPVFMAAIKNKIKLISSSSCWLPQSSYKNARRADAVLRAHGLKPWRAAKVILWGFCCTAGSHRCTAHAMNHSPFLNLIYSKCLPWYRDTAGNMSRLSVGDNGPYSWFLFLVPFSPEGMVHMDQYSVKGWGNRQLSACVMLHSSWFIFG